MAISLRVFAQSDQAMPPAASSANTDACCWEIRGNVNCGLEDRIDISDLTRLIDYMFGSHAPLCCFSEADINGDSAIDIADLTHLVAYMFKAGKAPAACPSWIRITDLQIGDDTVKGLANSPPAAGHRVVLWAKTDRWYIQPSTIAPFTYIQSDGTWSNYTNPWTRMTALLVDSSYVPGAIREQHPSSDTGVVAWDEYPEKSPDKFINWSGYQWRVKHAELTGPGPNAFSDDTANVRIDQSDRLHLKIDLRDNTWYCAEVVLDQSLGYGLYSFKLDSRVDSLDFNTIFAGFIYETTGQEFDFEFSQRLANPFNAQFVVQPWYVPGNIDFYDMPASSQTSHSFEWRPDRIVFKSWNGHSDSATQTTLIHTWTYTGDDIPIPGDENVRFNLYLYGGDPPSEGLGDEVIIMSFEYVE
jgi:hypothetical protein